MSPLQTRSPARTVLVVDDDQDMCWTLTAVLEGIGCRVTAVGTAQKALDMVAHRAFPLALVDARLPDMDGLRLIEALRSRHPGMTIILISGYYIEDDVVIRESVRDIKIDGFLAKPFRIDAIHSAVTALDQGRSTP